MSLLYEDAHNPRTEFPEESIAELAEDIQQRGVLQPLVVHPADSDGRHQVHFGAKRLRAAIRTGLREVPVVVRELPADRYAQIAENQKRHGLTPLELARFIRAQVDAGDSNATIASQLGMNLTAVAHHLSLLDLPPVLDDAPKSGRCTSPRTLHELSKLHAERPDQVHALLASEADITRASVSAIRSAADEPVPAEPAVSPPDKLITQANAACDRLERALSRINPPTPARSRRPNCSPCAAGSKPSPHDGCGGLTVRPLRRPNAEPMERGVKRVRKDEWQDRRPASEWMPCGIRREVRRGKPVA